LIRGWGYSVPTRFKKASTVGSPQYPAAIAAGIRRGQQPAGIIAERGIVKDQKRELPKSSSRTSSIRLMTTHDADHQQRLEMVVQANRRRRKRGALKGWIFHNHTGSPSTIGESSEQMIQLLAAYHLRRGCMSISVRKFLAGQQAVSAYRVDASWKRFAHPQRATVWPPFTFFEARSINFAIVVYSVFMHVEVDLHWTNFGIAEGNMAKKAKKAKKKTGKKKKK
jgi:hypothetical protein